MVVGATTVVVVVGTVVVAVGAVVVVATETVVGAVEGVRVLKVGGTASMVVEATRRAATGISIGWLHAPRRIMPEPIKQRPRR
jgi:hypothetical protein